MVRHEASPIRRGSLDSVRRRAALSVPSALGNGLARPRICIKGLRRASILMESVAVARPEALRGSEAGRRRRVEVYYV